MEYYGTSEHCHYVSDICVRSQMLFVIKSIDDFGVSDAILVGGANFGQTSIKYRDLACGVEPPPLKRCKDLTMKLEVKYLFPTSYADPNFYIYELP